LPVLAASSRQLLPVSSNFEPLPSRFCKLLKSEIEERLEKRVAEGDIAAAAAAAAEAVIIV